MPSNAGRAGLKAMRLLTRCNVVFAMADPAPGNELMDGPVRDVHEYGNVIVTHRERVPIVPDRDWREFAALG